MKEPEESGMEMWLRNNNQKDAALPALKTEEWGHNPRNVSIL